MTKSQMKEQWAQFRKMLEATRRIVDQFPEDKLDFRPTPLVRSVAELVTHNYHFLSEAVNSVLAGRHVPTVEPRISNKAMLMKWVDLQVAAADEGIHRITDAQLVSRIRILGEDLAGWQLLDMVYQEHLHHRGQLTLYLRMQGIVPVSVYNHGAQNG
ncbi:DinB family protein [bacterium]|nr:DinB family protein [bacterium]MBU1984554.1 DinB family protein [bacterium]